MKPYPPSPCLDAPRRCKDPFMWAFAVENIEQKINQIITDCDRALKLNNREDAPIIPARDVSMLHSKHHPKKKGLSTAEGQARMLHDLASIELQAMELGLRTLVEFPEAPTGFREELHAVTVSESQHLRMCLEGISDLGFKWGDWPIHCGLWSAVSSEDTLLDRILIVHRYLEGSGLDAGSTIIRRLDTSETKNVRSIVEQINREEIGHVDFGSRWYREICRNEKIDPSVDFFSRMTDLRDRLPKRIENINHELRLLAGFTIEEIQYFETLRQEFLIPFKDRLAIKEKQESSLNSNK